jgi:hypothetical protein
MTATLAEEQPRSVPLDARGLRHHLPHGVRQQRGPGAGWTGGEFKKIGVDYPCFRSRSENNFYPHYVHNLDNLIRVGASTRRSCQRRHPPDPDAQRDAVPQQGLVCTGQTYAAR